MALLPAFAPTSDSNIADRLSKPLPTISHHRYTQFIIGDDPIAPTTSTTSVATAPTVVASVPTATPVSDSDSAAPTLPIVLDTGASVSLTPSASDFLPVGHAAYGLFRSPISVVSEALTLASNTVDPSRL